MTARTPEAISSQGSEPASGHPAIAMPSSSTLLKTLSHESNVKRADCQKVLTALNRILIKEVQTNDSYKIPNLVMVQKKATPPVNGRAKKVFGKMVQVATEARCMSPACDRYPEVTAGYIGAAALLKATCLFQPSYGAQH